MHLGRRVGEVNILSYLYRVGSMANQVARELKGVGVGTLVGEGSGVGKHGGIEAGGHLARNVDAGGADELVDQLRDGAGAAVDPVHVGKGAAAGVVVDIDQKAVFQAIEAAARDAITLQQDHGVVVAFYPAPVPHQRRAGQGTVNARHPVAQRHVRALAHPLQHHPAGDQRAHRIAIGPGMRGHQQAIGPGDGAEDRVDGGVVCGVGGMISRRETAATPWI